MRYKIKFIWLYAFFLLIMSMIVVLSWDDFFWGGDSGIQLLNQKFEGYNGRYLGNIIIILMTRFPLVKVFLYTTINLGIVYLIYLLLSKKVNMSYIIFILITIPMDIFKQTFGWMSGFANYNVSSLLILSLLYLVLYKKSTVTTNILVLLISFISQFLTENVTITTIFISIGLICYYFFINKKKIVLPISWFIGASIGAWVMFQNTAYHTSGSRGFSNIFMSEFIKHLLQDWSELVVKNNIILISLFSIVIFLILNKPKWIGSFLLFFNIYFLGRDYLNISYHSQPLYMLVGELLLIFTFFALLIYTGIKTLKGSERDNYFFFLFSALLIVSPFLIVTPFGPRNILLSYLLLTLSLGILWEKVQSKIAILKLELFVKRLSAVILMFILFLYSVNFFEHQRRLAIIKDFDHQGKKSVVVRTLPFPFLGQVLDGISEKNRTEAYKDYYDISDNIEIKVADRTLPLPWIQKYK